MTWPSRVPDPPGALSVTCIDAHTEGEPLRVILEGFPEPAGETVLQRRRFAREHLDTLRTALMWEPRGHADMYGCIVVPPERPDSDFGVLFTHNEGYSSMCGHGVLAMARVAVEAGLVERREPVTPVTMDTPAGQVFASAQVQEGRVRSVSFRNVPAWSGGLDREVVVPGVGSVRYDLGFGGAFYAYVDAPSLGLSLVPQRVEELIRTGRAIKEAVQSADPPEHPAHPDLSFLYGTIFTGPPADPAHHSRHVCVFADGEVDRSPTGTGVSGRLALLHARGTVRRGESLVIESIVGSRFACRIVETTEAHGRPAVVTEVEGRAFVTGHTRFVLDPEDPFRAGFLVR
ncbi:MAG TPA: proline racemase family protein [Longimicrobiales bacterium]|nr:proline racemase family protein [Longimicrobiales bacterium]